MVRRIAALLAMLVAGPAFGASAHPLHTSFTEIVKDWRTGDVSVSVRLFADDFQAALDSLVALPSSQGVAREDVGQRYFERSVSLVMRDGRGVALSWCGMKAADGLIWLCARSAEAVPVGAIRVRNAMMFDRFADQISIVRWTTRTGSRTIVLSRRAAEATLD